MANTELTNMIMLEVDGKVLVLNRKKKFCGIAFPGGHVESGESIYDSAIREFREETGLTISNLKSKGFIYWEENESGFTYFTYFYKATEYTGELIAETAEGEVFWLDKQELKQQNLAPNMEKYLIMFEQDYSECFCTYKDGYKPHYR